MKTDEEKTKSYGLFDADSKLHGKGIKIFANGKKGFGDIHIGYFNNGRYFTPGSYIYVEAGRRDTVGEFVENAKGKLKYRGTEYIIKDGTTEKFGY